MQNANLSFPTVETHVIASGQIQLSMLPVQGSAVAISGYTQVTQSPRNAQFTVDYNSGNLQFPNQKNGASLEVTYSPVTSGVTTERVETRFTSTGDAQTIILLPQKPPKFLTASYILVASSGARYTEPVQYAAEDAVKITGAASSCISLSFVKMFVPNGLLNPDVELIAVALVGY